MKTIFIAGENIQKDKLVTISPEDGKVYKATPKEIATQQSTDDAVVEEKWLIYSLEHNGWWLPAERGYTLEKAKAGVYSYERACQIVESANINNLDVPNEAMIKICPKQ